MNFRKVIAGLGLIVIIGACGCSMGKEDTDEELTELTEQQIEILEQEGMPTDINQLSELQKYDIQKIDEMMTYMEETYGEEFVFDGYHEPELLDRWEKLYVYRAVDTDKTSLIEVERMQENGEWVYDDDYLCAYADTFWKELLEKHLNNMLDDNEYRIKGFSGLKNDATFENIKKDFKKYTYGGASIYVDGGTVSEEKYMELVKDLRKFGKEEGFEDIFSITLLKKGVMQQIEPTELSEYRFDCIRHDNMLSGY